MDNQIKYSIPKNIAEHFSPIEQRLIMRLYALASQVWSYDDCLKHHPWEPFYKTTVDLGNETLTSPRSVAGFIRKIRNGGVPFLSCSSTMTPKQYFQGICRYRMDKAAFEAFCD